MEIIANKPSAIPNAIAQRRLIEAAARAPSADNNQPWIFQCQADGRIVLHHDRSRALPSDGDSMFDMLALGAALENLCLAAGELGFTPEVRTIPLEEGPDAIATVRFAAGGRRDSLADQIVRRHTCRKGFERTPVPPQEISVLEETITGKSGLHLHWVSERDRVRTLARLVAVADRIRLESESFHAELYRQLRFTPDEARKSGDGLDIRCLEIPKLGALVLRWLRSWQCMRLLNKFGMSRLLTLPSALQVWQTGTIGILTTDSTDRGGFLIAGRALQRIWLTASAMGLSFHPVGSLPVFLKRSAITPTVNKIHSRFHAMFPSIVRATVAMVFRLGKSREPHVRSSRRPIEEVMIHESSGKEEARWHIPRY